MFSLDRVPLYAVNHDDCLSRNRAINESQILFTGDLGRSGGRTRPPRLGVDQTPHPPQSPSRCPPTGTIETRPPTGEWAGAKRFSPGFPGRFATSSQLDIQERVRIMVNGVGWHGWLVHPCSSASTHGWTSHPCQCVCECARSERCKSSSGRRSPACNRRKPRRREAGWKATGGERPVRNARELDSACSRGEPAGKRRSPNRCEPAASHAEG